MVLTEKVFSGNINFIAGAGSIPSIPQLNLPEFAFIGRSNVGKSSLINAICNRNALCRTSQNPGCTKQINFYSAENAFSLVDLPGYGFARLNNKERNAWDNLIHTYLRGRKQLLKVFLLIDSRHELKEIDKKTMIFLDDYAISYQLILTKYDKPSATLPIHIEEMKDYAKKRVACYPEVLLTSSREKLGIPEIRNVIINDSNNFKF